MNLVFPRKQRKSMLGTRHRHSTQILKEPSPSLSDHNSTLKDDDATIVFPKNQRKSMFDTRERNSFQMFKEPSPTLLDQTILHADCDKENEVFKKPSPASPDRTIVNEDNDKENEEIPIRTRVVCSLFVNDSFEENETRLANLSFNETTILATSLLETQKKDEDARKLMKTNNILLKENGDDVTKTLQERQRLLEWKQGVMEKFNLIDNTNNTDVLYIPNEEEIFQRHRIRPSRKLI